MARALPSGQGPSPAHPRSSRPDSTRGAKRGGQRAGGPAAQAARTSRGLRRGAGPARRTRAPRIARRLSARTAVLGVVVVALMLTYAYPVRVYLAQQAQISQMQSDQAEQRQNIQDLTERLERWDDEEYIAAQARSRLQMVRPGELLYVVGEPPATGGVPAEQNDEAWLHRLWSNLQAVDDPVQP